MSRSDEENDFQRWLKSESFAKGAFLTCVASVSALASFSYAFSGTRKRDPNALNDFRAYESGSRLALRALKWGTFYAFSGCGTVIFTIWKLSGAHTMVEFREKMGSLLPRVPKSEPQGRTEFESVTDLMQYLNDEFSTPKKSEEISK